MKLSYIVRFQESARLGLVDRDPQSSAVVPAWVVLSLVEGPQSRDPIMVQFQRVLHEETLHYLRSLGGAMMVVQATGAREGDYEVRPYFISQEQWLALEQLRMRNAENSGKTTIPCVPPRRARCLVPGADPR